MYVGTNQPPASIAGRNPVLPRSWHGEAVGTAKGTLTELRGRIPTFCRRPFSASMPTRAGEGVPSEPNRLLDVIVRAVDRTTTTTEVAVGIVGKKYHLVQHQEILDAVREACTAAKLPADTLNAELDLSEYGTRMCLKVHFPEQFNFEPGDGHTLGLHLLTTNAVDGSAALRCWLGWYRFVCSNGLIVGSTLRSLRWRHAQSRAFPDVVGVITSGLDAAARDKVAFNQWTGTPLEWPAFENCVNGPLTKVWGVVAAARVWHIAQHGFDAELADRFAKGLATEKPMTPTVAVPGCPDRAETLWDAAQALSWVAQSAGNPEAVFERQAAIPGLLRSLKRRQPRLRAA